MKKILLILLALTMVLMLVACGNNDENNAAVQMKVDEYEATVNEICAWFEDNGLLEGEYAAEFQPVVDEFLGNLTTLKTNHQEILDGGGYDDDETATVIAAIDSDLAIYQEALATAQEEIQE